MKKYLAFIFFNFCFCKNIFPQLGQNTLLPVLTLEKDTIDYGTMEARGYGYRAMKFRNTGKSPLLIYDVKTNGGGNVCRSPKKDERGWTTDTIYPGQYGVIYSCYCTDRIGHFYKNFYVYSNSINPITEFHIYGGILPPK